MSDRVLITGVAGFVGSNLVRELLANTKAEVHGLLRPNTNTWRLKDINSESRLHLHQVDLLDRDALVKVISQIKPTVIYHLAAHGAYHWQTEFEPIFTTNVFATWYLHQALADHSYRAFINVGSSSEYGWSTQPMRETDRLSPNSLYAVAKAAQTQLVGYLGQVEHKPILTVRLFSVFGPYEDRGKLWPTVWQSTLTHQPLKLADPQAAHDFIYVDDVTAALRQLSQAAFKPGSVFNLGTGRQTTLGEVAACVEQVAGQTLAVEWSTHPAHRWDTHHWVANPRQLQRLLHWKPRYDLTTAAQAYWRWFQTNHHIYDHHSPAPASSDS